MLDMVASSTGVGVPEVELLKISHDVEGVEHQKPFIIFYKTVIRPITDEIKVMIRLSNTLRR